MPTVTFTPDADPETNSVDGYIENNVGDDTWSAVHDPATGTDSQDAINLDVELNSSSTTDQWAKLVRTGLLFLIDIPVGATIVSANLGFYVQFSTGGSFGLSLSLVSFAPAANTSLTTADFGSFGTTRLASDVAVSGLSGGSTPVFALNGSGLANITPGSVSGFGLRFDCDVDNAPPVWSSSTSEQVVITESENAGFSFAPYLEITYTVPADAYTLDGPTSGMVNVASTDFTVTPNGLSSATVTPASTGAGSFTPATVTFDGTESPKTFTYTPTSTAGSPHTISVTNNGGLTNPGSLSYTVNGVMAQEDYQYLPLNRLVIFQQQTPAVALPIPETIEFVQPLFDDEGGLFHQTTEE